MIAVQSVVVDRSSDPAKVVVTIENSDGVTVTTEFPGEISTSLNTRSNGYLHAHIEVVPATLKRDNLPNKKFIG